MPFRWSQECMRRFLSACSVSQMRFLWLALVPLAACSTTANYAGELRPVAGTCDPASQAVLTLRKSAIVFAPAAGTVLLRGELVGQSVVADLTLDDPNKHPYRLAFQGTLSASNIIGIYSTPRCKYAVTLHLTTD